MNDTQEILQEYFFEKNILTLALYIAKWLFVASVKFMNTFLPEVLYLGRKDHFRSVHYA
ncbi:hypothetical protein U14_03786 [Candidatus Moduliflexus flocculans]|uniref:Uncharacterized protein n=1 Tax=Candidatus Moduliflexus flocculans TaxID=1499966 RepID=A0A081BQ69_9BACT|nr:hypothetical protein U14_03786 [Candidatus Moduliflexus flocculans]